MSKALENFKRCCEEAPEGTYEDAKTLNYNIGGLCDSIIQEVRSLGLKADSCDLIWKVEATIYDYVKQSNPDNPMFAVAEGFGEAMNGPARERVIQQAERDREFLRDLWG